MRRRLALRLLGFAAAVVVGAAAAVQLPTPAQAAGQTYYWISHGSPADPVWTYFLAGAKQWEKDTGNTVNTSFHSGDVPSHQEAVRAAIAAKADGIVSSSPDPGSLVEVVKEAKAAGIPRGAQNGWNLAIGHAWHNRRHHHARRHAGGREFGQGS